MNKIKTKAEKVKRISQLPVINPIVAGIDVSDKEMVVAFLLILNNWRYGPFDVLPGIFT